MGERIYACWCWGPWPTSRASSRNTTSRRSSSRCRRPKGGLCVASLDACRRAGVEARAVPGVFELLDGGVSVSRLREVDIADLLRRRPIEVKPHAPGCTLHGKTVLVTGAGGCWMARSGRARRRRLARNGPWGRFVTAGTPESGIIGAWEYQWLVQLPETQGSWALPLEVGGRSGGRDGDDLGHRPTACRPRCADPRCPAPAAGAGQPLRCGGAA